MDRKRQLEITEGVFVPAAEMLTMGFLNSLAGKPVGDLIVADDHCACPLGDGDAVPHVVAVSVADEDEVRLHSFRGNGSGGVACEEGIDNDFIAARLKPEGSMSVPGKFRSHKNLLFYTV